MRTVGPIEAFTVAVAAVAAIANLAYADGVLGAVILAAVGAHVAIWAAGGWDWTYLQFSLRTLLIAMTIACIVLGLLVALRS